MGSIQTKSNHERVASNTLFLYLRMLILMGITFYTSRVVLNALGEVDYGVNNVVAGFVSMFVMFSHTMSGAISRYITFSLGQDDKERTKAVFSNALLIQMGLGVVIFVVGEILMVWFLNHKMDVPPERMHAANIVLQLSLINFILNLFRAPFDACIVAHERMSVYAYLGLLEGLFNLVIALIVKHSNTDRLILYATLNLMAVVLVILMYVTYSRLKFDECRLVWAPEKKLIVEMLGFSGWNFVGVMAGVLRGQGINMLLNLFCGPVVNAARGLAMQVDKAVTRFSSSFVMAINPQITKNYAAGQREEYERLTMTGSKISFLLLFFLCLPVLMQTGYLLDLWLVKVPEHTRLFVILILCQALVDSFSTPLITLLLATGDIGRYQILVGGATLLNFPLAYLLLYLGFMPESTVCSIIAISVVTLSLRLYCLHRQIGFPVKKYLCRVTLVALRVVLLSIILPLAMNTLWTTTSISVFVLKVVAMETVALVVIVWLGLNKAERHFIYNTIKKKLK